MKFPDYQNPNDVSEKSQGVNMLESFLSKYKELNESIEKAKEYIQEIKSVSDDFVRQEEVEQLFATQLILVSDNLQNLKEDLKDINKKDVDRLTLLVGHIDAKTKDFEEHIKDIVSTKYQLENFEFTVNKSFISVDNSLKLLAEKTVTLSEQIPETKKQFISLSHETTKNRQLVEKLDADLGEKLTALYETLKENSSVIEILSQSYDTILTPAVEKINEFQSNIDTISGLATQYNETIEQTKQDIRAVVNEVNQIFINDKYLELDRKLQRVEEMFNAKVQLNEEQDKPDAPPISPVQQGFDPGQVSSLALKVKFLEQSIGRIVATGPGSGETRLRFLDDVDASTIGNNKYLRYNSTKNKFEFATVSGGGGSQVQSDWTQTDNTDPSFILNKPTIPAAQIQSDWTQTNNSSLDYIKNKPTLATVATSGSYNDLIDQPTIPAAQIKSDWTETDTSLVSFILNKPTLFSGDYGDLTNKPSLFSGDYNDLTNLPTLFSGDYNDLTNQPTIPAALTDLTDVAIVTPSNGEVLKYNSSTGKW